MTAVTGDEAEALQRLAKSRRVLELGALNGYSALVLATTAERVYSVDWHFGDGATYDQSTWESFGRNTAELRKAGKIVPLVGRFDSILPLLQPASFELIFHDGAHDAASVGQDLRLALPLLDRDGVLAVHDWGLFGVMEGARPVVGDPTLTLNRLAVWEKAGRIL